ncbi:MAG: hypothetical protein AB8B97_14440 [Granulosicoccus sp.]
MKVRSFTRPVRLQRCRKISILAGLVLLSGLAVAEENLTAEELEKLVVEQQVFLQEAIANREATAAQTEALRAELQEIRERSRQIEEEVEVLCRELESLTSESFIKCMASSAN